MEEEPDAGEGTGAVPPMTAPDQKTTGRAGPISASTSPHRGGGDGADPGHYLQGARPYPAAAVQEYVRRGWWIGETYPDLFRRAVRRSPRAEALSDGRRRLSWHRLELEVVALARALAGLGVGPQDRVLLQLPNRVEYVVAFHAAQALGAVPVLALPRHGPSELADLVRLTRPAAWFLPSRDGGQDVDAAFHLLKEAGVLPPLAIQVGPGIPMAGALPMEELVAGREAQLEALSPPPCGPDDVALIGLTGGATGRSRAVPRTHNSFLLNVRLANGSSGPDDVFLCATPVGHTMANQGSLGGWLRSAGRLVMVESPHADAILEAVERERVTRVGLVPAQLAELLDHPASDTSDLSSLRRVVSTGAPLPAGLARRTWDFFRARGCTFAGSAYGSTEGPCCGHEAGEPPELLLGTVGRPDCEVNQWAVLDPSDRELPPGEIGQIAVGGPSVFTGYYGSPEDDARIFTESGLYRTGDLGFIDRAGHLHLTGRLKDVIERGGEPILPAEIEELLAEHPAVRQVAVVAMPDPRLGERPCACIVPVPGARPGLEQLVRFLRERGAGPLRWPERVELFHRLPLTPAGKLDRPALRREVAARLHAEEGRRT